MQREGSIASQLSDDAKADLGIFQQGEAASPQKQKRYRSWSPDAVLRSGWQPVTRRAYENLRDALVILSSQASDAAASAREAGAQAAAATADVIRSRSRSSGAERIFRSCSRCFLCVPLVTTDRASDQEIGHQDDDESAAEYTQFTPPSSRAGAPGGASSSRAG